jgi:hypothetical protein
MLGPFFFVAANGVKDAKATPGSPPKTSAVKFQPLRHPFAHGNLCYPSHIFTVGVARLSLRAKIKRTIDRLFNVVSALVGQ